MNYNDYEQFFNKYNDILKPIPLTSKKISNIIYLVGQKKNLMITRSQMNIFKEYYNENDIFVNFETWHNKTYYFTKNIQHIYNYNNLYRFTNEKEFEDINKNIHHIHHDISLPLDVFIINYNVKQYNKGVITTGPAPYKRLQLINDNPYIIRQDSGDKIPKYKTTMFYNPPKRVNLFELSWIINQFKFGAVFSAMEGGCNSSAEYLACGLPVLSTESKGGRNTWYNENNSIICKDNNKDILIACEDILNKYNNNVYNREGIREQFISDLNIHKNKFRNIMYKILDEIELNVNHKELIEDILSLRYISRSSHS